MSLVHVYSRSPISHQFKIVKNGVESVHVIKGTNSHAILTGGVHVPYQNEMEEEIFNQIKETYKNHPWLFGGEHPETKVKLDAQIYVSKTSSDAKKKMDDSKPILDQSALIGKTAGIEKFKEER